MPHAVTSLKRPSSYSHCPLKKRPLKYDPLEDSNSDSELSCKGASPLPLDPSEPENLLLNLSTKPEDLRVTSTLKEKTLPSPPPPISLVAGRGDGHPLAAHQQFRHHMESTHFENKNNNGTLSTFPGAYNNHHQIKSNTGGPLGPLNLNAPAAWSKINPYVPSMPLNYTTVSAAPRAAFGMFSPPGPVPRSAQQHHQHLGQFSSSHFSPLNNFREPESPPHVSPPLSNEPAYPVLRIEENNRSRMVSPSSYSEEIKRESFVPPPHSQHQHLQHHLSNMKQEINCHSHLHSLKQEYCESTYYNNSYQLSPSHSPNHDSGNSRDSIHSQHQHGDEKRSSPNLAPPIVPINVNGSVRYQCPDCSKSYSTYSGLSKHMQFHCASQNKKSFVCKFCEKVYVSLGALKMHIRTHTLPCKCTICGKAFSRPWLLQGHIRTHTGEKPFNCEHCHRAFADRSNLRAHLQTHSEVKKYSCRCCSKTFSRMSLLVKHEEGGCSNSILTNSE